MEFTAPDGIKTYHTKPYPRIDVARPELSTAGKVVLITGGGSGLGLVIAEHFAKAGSRNIAITGRRENVLEEARQKIESAYPGTKVLTLPGDVADRAVVYTAFKTAKDTFGPINVVINNAGYEPEFERLGTEASADDWWRVFETNVKGSHNVLGALSQAAAQDATVINISSATVNTVLSHQSAYSSSKIASTRLFEVFQVENPNYRVINVAPGIVQTDMLDINVKFFEKLGWPPLPIDDIELPASYVVWASSPEAAFLKGKFVWVHWDVEELKPIVAAHVEDKSFLTLAIHGMPNVSLPSIP